jgi:hypothetical protein
MPSEPSHQTHLQKSRELIVLAARLVEEYAELQKLSRALRKESRQLSEDSHVLRRLSTRLLRDENTDCAFQDLDEA